jgi:exodeoxyribonuclease VII large subunit
VIDRLARQLERQSPRALDHATRVIDGVETRVRALDPARVLARGWSITRDGNGQLVRSTGDVASGARLVTTLSDGTIASTVDG